MLATLALLLGFSASRVPASEETAAEEELECSICHQDSEGSILTDPGRYYELMETLEGFDQVTDTFGSCIYCHVPEAGSADLTPEGQTFRWMMEDMKGLRAWLDENHPRPEADESDAGED